MLTYFRRLLRVGKEDKGFTLIELMVVVAILGILAAVAIPKFTDSTVNSKKSRVKSDLKTIETAISMYKADYNDNAPPSISVLVTDNYLKALPYDPWTNLSYNYGNGTPWFQDATNYGGSASVIYSWTTPWPSS